MELQLLETNTIEHIFHHHIVKDFPAAETRPLKNMLQLYHYSITEAMACMTMMNY